MKTTKKILLTILVIVLAAPAMFAQTYEWKKPPKPTERVLGTVECSDLPAGFIINYYSDCITSQGHGSSTIDKQKKYSDEQQYRWLKEYAESLYINDYPSFDLRNFMLKTERQEETTYEKDKLCAKVTYLKYILTATVVVPNNKMHANISKIEEDDDLTKALCKALQDIREGSRIAIDQVRVLSGMDKNEYKDQIVEILIDKGYKVVAKEYLEKLYDEQQAQQSGIYNSKTTVKENNFSAVGYYLNVRLTETSLRVQVINVSTGEYDANVTIKL